MLKSKILFTNVEDLQYDAKHDLIRINAFKQQQKNMKKMYEASSKSSKAAMMSWPSFSNICEIAASREQPPPVVELSFFL